MMPAAMKLAIDTIPRSRGRSLEVAAAASLGGRIASPILVASVALLAFLAGKAVGEGRFEVALLSVASVAGLAVFRYLEFPAWSLILLFTTVLARGSRALLGLPPVTDFLHFAVVFGFALAATNRPTRAASRAPGRWILGFLLIVLLSAIAHPSDPMRSILFVLIAGEPLLVVWTIARWGPDDRSVRAVGVTVVALAVIQAPIALYQGLTYGWTDPVQGTLAGHGAGHHVLGGLFALALFVVVSALMAGRVNLVLGALGATLCLAMIIATGSMAVLVIATFAGLAAQVVGAFGWGQRVARRRWAALVAAVLIGSGALVFAAAWVPGIYERAATLAGTGGMPEREMIQDRMTTDPLAVVLGSGPGTSSSRASLLLTGPKEGSPLAFLGIEPTDLGRQIAAEVSLSNEQFGGSVESASSGSLAIIGDLGLVGFCGAVLFVIMMWRTAGRSRSWLAPAAQSAVLMTAALSLVDNWWEYPEFALPLAILIGIVMSDVPARG